MIERKIATCPFCGSYDVTVTNAMYWDVGSQSWKNTNPINVEDETDCQECGASQFAPVFLGQEAALLEHVGEYWIPEWAMPYLINGDASGIDDTEAELADKWLAALGHDRLAFEITGAEEELCVRPAFGLPGLCVTVQVYGYEKGKPAGGPAPEATFRVIATREVTRQERAEIILTAPNDVVALARAWRHVDEVGHGSLDWKVDPDEWRDDEDLDIDMEVGDIIEEAPAPEAERVRYSHAYSLAFELETEDEDGELVTQTRMAAAIIGRVHNLVENNKLLEAVGAPDDTMIAE